MLKRFLLISLGLLLATLAVITNAQGGLSTASASSAAVAGQQASSESAELQAAKQQIKLLEAQLQTVREFQGSILDTVYWALGGVFIALSLVFGLSWFANFKLYDRDKVALQDDLHSKIESSVKELKAENATSALNLERRVDGKFEEWRRTAEDESEVTTNKIQSNSQTAVTSLQRSVATIQRDTLRLQIKTEEDPTQQMTLARRLLYDTIDAAPHEVPSVITEMLRSLESGAKLTLQDVTSLNNLLDKVPPEHAAFVKKLQEGLVVAATR